MRSHGCWRGLGLLLLVAGCLGRAGAVPVAFVSTTGACPSDAPRGVDCMTFRKALEDPEVGRIVLMEEVKLQQNEWARQRCARLLGAARRPRRVPNHMVPAHKQSLSQTQLRTREEDTVWLISCCS